MAVLTSTTPVEAVSPPLLGGTWLPKRLQHLPLRQKLTWLSVVTSATALLLASGGFIIYELFTFRSTMVHQLSVQAQIIANNSTAALVFNDRAAAQETLRALQAEPHILTAAIYTAGEEVFATYKRHSSLALPPPLHLTAEMHHQFLSNHLLLAQEIASQRDVVGWVQIQADTLHIRTRLLGYGGIVLLVFCISLLSAFLLSARLQRIISSPIIHLVNTAQFISQRKDYSVRSRVSTQDELGLLGRSFNDMLAQIQQRDQALLEARALLEQRVKDRTQKLRHEIQDRRAAEEEIRRLNAELEQRVLDRTAQLQAANKELEAFSYSVSHDLRAPLRSIDGFSQFLLEDYAEVLDAEGKSYLSRVRAASKRMGVLIDDLLGLSRVTRSKMRREQIDLSAMVQAIAEELRSTHPDRTVTFRIEEGITAVGDATLLRAVLENLLGNAWKYTSKHETAHIEFGCTATERSDRTFFVRDDGAGFDMEYVEKLFGAFQRLHTDTDFDGTGIGLATVQRIVNRHGGQVWAEGRVEAGATFFFTLG